MNQGQPANPNPWAKLIAMQYTTQNITLHPDRNEHPFANEWIIYRKQDGKINIKNISAQYLRVEETSLQKGQERELLAGERLSLTKKKNFDFVFCVVNSQSGFKRDRDDLNES